MARAARTWQLAQASVSALLHSGNRCKANPLAAPAGRLYPNTDQYSVSDPTSPYTQAAVFTIDRTNAARPKLNYVTLDINNAQLTSTNVCIDGDGETIFLPFIWNNCADAGLPIGDVYLDLA